MMGLLALAVSALAAVAPPPVTLMVAGRDHALLGPVTVRAAAGSVSVRGAGRCSVPAGTALAALAFEARRGRLRLGVTANGSCSPALLFVRSIDGRSNRGDGGWEYKVDGGTPGVGAAVPAGQGGARVHRGAHILWFYCGHAGRCQPTLELSLPAHASPGAALTASVVGRDDNGRTTPVAGASVSLDGHVAITDAAGHAGLTAPATPGRYTASVRAPGLVDAFPQTLAVG